MRERQREKDAEILVLRYALVEMDRKVTELEKKNNFKTASAKSTKAAITSTKTPARTNTTNSATRGNSRA